MSVFFFFFFCLHLDWLEGAYICPSCFSLFLFIPFSFLCLFPFLLFDSFFDSLKIYILACLGINSEEKRAIVTAQLFLPFCHWPPYGMSWSVLS